MKKTIVVYWASDYRASLVFKFLQGIYRYLEQKKEAYEVVIHPFNPGTLKEKASLTELSVYSACIICTAAIKDIKFLEGITTATPIILYNRFSEKYCSVIVDNRSIGNKAAQYLWDRGKRRALVLAADKKLSFVNERIEGFTAAFEKLEGRIELMETQDNTLISACQSLENFDFSDSTDLGVFCTSDILALGLLKRFQELDIPKDAVDLVCIGTMNEEITSFILQGFSIIEIPIEKMGYRCMELVSRIVGGKVTEPFTIKVDFSFR